VTFVSAIQVPLLNKIGDGEIYGYTAVIDVCFSCSCNIVNKEYGAGSNGEYYISVIYRAN
jgi:hypothetical protein